MLDATVHVIFDLETSAERAGVITWINREFTANGLPPPEIVAHDGTGKPPAPRPRNR